MNFVSLTGDRVTLHTDVEFANKSICVEKITHEMLVLFIAFALSPPYNLAFLAFL
ncbi:MAG: hypothetical protein J7L53_08090 [Deltaproteobacteria bacterium]|nr:hypothetical protein [Deltaproteobacteria bacterium]